MKTILSIFFIALSLSAISAQQGTTITGSGWVGLEFSKGVTITQISWTQQSEGDTLGVFEGANDKSFLDGIPLYIITSNSAKQAEVKVTQSFKYVRYVAPKGKTSSISSFQVTGTEGESTGEPKNLYTPTKLPLVVVHTTDGKDPVDKENQLTSNIIIIKDGAINVKGSGTIKLRGNSTLNQPKKPFRIKFDEAANPLGFKATAKKWVLFANAYDKTLIRNYVAYKMSDLLGLKWAPQCTHVDMVLNGDFIGNYLFCDQIDVNENRVNIQKIGPNDNSEPAVTGGYIVEIDFYAEKEPAYFKTTSGGVLVTIKYPGADTTPQQKAYISKKISDVEVELNNGKFDNIDIDNFLQYFVLQDFTGSPDSLFSSVYLSKDRGSEKINIGPIWDVDLAFGNMRMGMGMGGGTTTQKNFGFKSGMGGGVANTVTKILGNNVVLPKLKEFWKKVTTTSLTTSALFDFIDKAAKSIDDSQKLNSIRWDSVKSGGSSSWFSPSTAGSFDADIKNLKQFIQTRMEEFTQIINDATVESITKQTSTGGWGGFGGGGQGGQWGGQGGQGGQWGGQGGQGGQWGGFGGQTGQGGQWGGFGGQTGQGGQWGGFGG